MKPVSLLSISPYVKMSESAECFAYKVYNCHVETIKQIQANNEQY